MFAVQKTDYRWIVKFFIAVIVSAVFLSTPGVALADEATPVTQTDTPPLSDESNNQANNNVDTQESGLQVNDNLLWIMISAGGMVGGLLFGMRDKTLVIPHQDSRSKYIFKPGFLVDLLFGLVGGFVIFMVVPGDFNFDEGGFVVVKILALAAIGGYGGRALIETVLQKQIQEIKDQIQDIQDQSSIDATALSLVDQQLDDDPNTVVDEDELRKTLLSSSSNVRVAAFSQAREFRQEALKEQKLDAIKQVIPIFETLIEADKRDHEQEKYHSNHGQLGYALKDMENPDNPRAIKELTKAIEVRNEGEDKNLYRMYEFNRAICNIRMKSSFDVIKADLDAAMGWTKSANCIQHPDGKKAPELVAWLHDPENREKLGNWIAANNIELGDMP
jgi:hypothetical protein